MAETITITTPNVTQINPPVVQTTTPSIIPTETAQTFPVPIKDLTTKVAEFKKAKIATPAPSNDEIGFDFKEIEAIKDPVAKEVAMKAYKSMQSGFTKKTQEIAEQKRQFDQKMAEMQNWTPERIQRELSNPEFVKSAQMYASQNPPNSGLTDEQFSALTPMEKAELAQVPALKNKVSQLEQVNFQTQVAQRDSQLQTRYPDYNPTQIDLTIKQLAQMSPLDIREHIYKSLKHDEDVAAAYELGKSERSELNQTKINAITPNGSFATTSDGLPIREKGDTDQTYFMKMANFRLAQFKNKKVS